MTYFKKVAAITASFLTLASAANANETNWQITLEALTLDRAGMGSVPLVVNGGGVQLSADELDIGFGAGAKLTAYKDISSADSVGIEFFFVDQMDVSATFSNADAQFTVYGADFGSAVDNLEYETDIYSFEVNWRHQIGSGPFRAIAGLRAIQNNEMMIVSDGVSPPDLFIGDLENQMFGLQIGLETSAAITNRLTLDAGIKAGFFNNSGTFDAAFPQAGPSAVFHSEMSYSASTLEFALGASYQVNDRISANIGYQVMMINGIAVLPEQLDDLAVPILGELDMDGHVIYQGLSLGIRYVW